MSTEAWRPLDEREAGGPAPEPVLFEGVPEHLEYPLREWLETFFSQGQHAQRVGLRLRIAEEGPLDETLASFEDEELLTVLDAALYFHPAGISLAARSPWASTSTLPLDERRYAESVIELGEMLADAGSAWTLTNGGRALQHRVDATVQQAVDTAMTSASTSGRPEAARDLAEAWAKVYGLHPDPSDAYRVAIRAVEDVAIPLMLPTSRLATLGKVRDHLRDAPAKWCLSMGPDTEPLLAMVNLLWTRQTDRHAGQADLARINQAAAEQAVHLATTLVQWFAAGHVQRVP